MQMLKSIYIKNIALISSLTIEFGAGLNVLSGETGAGKSIIVDSLNFILGERADKSLLRHGEAMAAVEAVFEIDGESAKATLRELTGEDDDIIVINRTLNAEGKSDIRLNGRMLSLSMLKRLTALIVDIHGQHEHQSLLKTSKHTEVLDFFAPREGSEIKQALSALLKEYRQITKELSSFGADEDERARRADILSYQISEIKAAKLSEKEEAELLKKRDMIANQEKIIAGLSEAAGFFSAGGETFGVKEMMDGVVRGLRSAARFYPEVEEYLDRAEAARAEIADIAEGIEDTLASLDYSEKDADKLQERLDTIKLLKRKYGGDIAAVYGFLKEAEAEFERLTNSAELIEKLKRQKELSEEKIYAQCSRLSDLRRDTALIFEERVKKELGELGMANSVFKVQFADKPYIGSLAERAGPNGFDNLEFYLSPNIGEPLKPLIKIISGGEMSRFMLAIKNITADAEGIGTMIFDEIDAGISGKMGQVVACKLASIAKNHQVICVSHLPQLAAMADRNFLISKAVTDGKTITGVKTLQNNEILEEVSRLSGGKDISAFAQKHAQDMKQWSEEYKKSL